MRKKPVGQEKGVLGRLGGDTLFVARERDDIPDRAEPGQLAAGLAVGGEFDLGDRLAFGHLAAQGGGIFLVADGWRRSSPRGEARPREAP